MSATTFSSWTPSNNSNMKAVEEPAYLTVGTDVSAKYRGAFCEAKIKTVKRLVKVKVTLKGESSSQVVQDDQVKGLLRVGSTVEVKTSEGGCSEAVISKLTDASLYTVVFDDGDEKTLRRTSLCLKGERHFAESETLDQLPLTNPEHFGTPVIGKKSNRGRRFSQALADEENESSSSDDEEDDRRRINDELLGKVCSVEIQGEPGLVLVVCPSCNEELVVKKDQCLVRSFGDGKFSTVSRRSLALSSVRSEFSDRKGLEAAHAFLRSRTVPEVWKMDMSQILESSSSDEEEEKEKPTEEEQEEEPDESKNKRIKDEPEEEADPEERDHFLQQLYKFMEDRGTPINKPPVLGYKDLNLFKLFRLVYLQGGCHSIESGTIWKQIYMDLGIPILNSAAAYNVKTAYKKYLYGFEEYCRSALITFRTIHHNDPRPPASPANQRTAIELKPSPPSNQRAAGAELKDAVKMETDSDSDSDKELKDRYVSPRGRRRCVVSLKDSRSDKRTTDLEERRDVRRRSLRPMDQSERGSEDEEEEDDEEENEPHNLGDRSEEDPDGDSVTGTKVRVKYGRGKTQKIYEAHIKKTDVDNGEPCYLVHYYGWNVRYDEWVKADRIIWPVEKGCKKKRGRKHKSKEEPERDEERLLKGSGGRRGRPQGSSNLRSVSRTNGKQEGRPDSGLSNGDNTPRRRTRRTSGMYDSDRASNEDSGNSSDDSESDDASEKKSSPWRRVEACPNQEVEACLKQEVEEEQRPRETSVNSSESVAETTASDTTAPSMPQDSPPGQSEQGADPDPQVKAEQKETPSVPLPSTENHPKLKLLSSVVPVVVLPPRSEPMVVLHHCLPPGSDTDSASENETCEDKADEAPLKQDTTFGQDEPESVKTLLKQDTDQTNNCLNQDENEEEISSKEDESEGSETPQKQDKIQGEKESKEDENENKPDQNEGEKTMLKRKAPEQKTPEKKLKTEADLSPETTNMAPEELYVNAAEEKEEEEVKEYSGTEEEELTDKKVALDEDSVPSIGPEALVCHEVLDEPDEKAVAASEQLLMMREAHLTHLPTQAPPTAVESSSDDGEKDTEQDERGGGKETTLGNITRAEDVNSSPASNSSSSDRGQKRLIECNQSPTSKKHKRSNKRPTPHKTDKHGAGQSSDSEDQTRVSLKTHKTCPSPTGGHKWTFQIDELEKMSSSERISFLQEKLQEIRKYYMSLKSEVASIDRRRKRLKKKEREVSNTASASSSSDAGMSPSSSSPSQSSVAVEVR